MTERIGFIGLGNMGRPMATSLATKGFALTVHDVVEARARVLEQRGASRAADVAAAVAASDVVVTMLPDTPDVLLVHDQLMRTGRAGQLHLDMSSIDPASAKRMAAALAAKGIARVDAGVGRSYRRPTKEASEGGQEKSHGLDLRRIWTKQER